MGPSSNHDAIIGLTKPLITETSYCQLHLIAQN